MPTVTLRSPDEIAARVQAPPDPSDFGGFFADVAAQYLPYEQVKPLLKPGVTPDEWGADVKPLTVEQVVADALHYLDFAFGKARDHRGLSANRSITKLGAYAWLLGLDTAAMDGAGFAQYGVPKLVAFAGMLRDAALADPPIPEGEDLARMARGIPCDPNGCGEGCGDVTGDADLTARERHAARVEHLLVAHGVSLTQEAGDDSTLLGALAAYHAGLHFPGLGDPAGPPHAHDPAELDADLPRSVRTLIDGARDADFPHGR